ncbi:MULTISPECIES: GNAT family N-acetyltransferase [unclassified Leisingera]|uniref:GNAT family N-acetyltransferase n=1 Tax=unclassified Leisingera TaxID=2614906 RepID=UPI00035E5ED0|nr:MULTISPECIES: GNAT family N-acetyltransferase [unclassified Leisingera]KIC14872.1 acetyltransferase [Leisingera sp. ANG-DT]KIC23440.1 acetyltransferase [Leisingera sp. ANG-S3]KIC30944.1 acetyltransferase [Leisingera sp. ANG-M6]KIC34017.1 acetyltransferase [Leisingera sp. ANG-S5]KIC54921.1 acetyltransferase [Leisingera sp. ANG-S]
MTPPVLETERLILRPHGVQDFEAVAALWAEPEVVRFISGTPSAPEESWTRLLRYIGHWQALGYGYWAVTLRESGRFIGEVGFADYQRSMEPPLAGVPEAGWVLAPEVHGRGMATEAVGCIHEWAAEATDWAETACIFDPAHTVSHRVALKLGYAPAGEALYRGNPTLVMKRPVSR